MTSSAAMNIWFLHCQNLPLLKYIHCSFCLNLHISHGDMKENVSGVFCEHSVELSSVMGDSVAAAVMSHVLAHLHRLHWISMLHGSCCCSNWMFLAPVCAQALLHQFIQSLHCHHGNQSTCSGRAAAHTPQLLHWVEMPQISDCTRCCHWLCWWLAALTNTFITPPPAILLALTRYRNMSSYDNRCGFFATI